MPKNEKIKRYVFTKEEEINEGKWFHGNEDLELMAQTMENVVDHYKKQGVEFWYDIMVDAENSLCYLGKTKESFQKEYDEGYEVVDFTKAKHLDEQIFKRYCK